MAGAPAGSKETISSSASKKRSASNAAHNNVAQVNEQQERDIAHCVMTMRANPAPLAAHVAGLLRDEVLQKAVKKAAEGPISSNLGKLLPPKLKKMRSLPCRTKLMAIMEGCPALANSSGDPPVVLPEGADNRILEFMLNADGEVKPPDTHTGSNFEVPMLKVLSQRRVDMGDRLQKVSVEDLQAGTFGYFVWDKKDPTKMTTWLGQELADVISEEESTRMTDLELIDNHSHQARLRSPSEDWSKGLMAVVRRQYPQVVIVDPKVEFEYPGLCIEFEGMVPESCRQTKVQPKKKSGPVAKARMPKVARPAKECKAKTI
jgi:hypothetical protein